MKVIGLIGGMSWESSMIYYKMLNEKVKKIKGGFASCRCIMYSVDFAQIEKFQHKGDWDSLDTLMSDAAQKLYIAGAEIVVLCTNTMHLCNNAISSAVPIPFLHIAEATGKKIQAQKLKTIGLLGTSFTMEKEFYKKIIKDTYDIDTIVPNQDDRNEVHRIIYEELVKGNIKEKSKEIYKEIIAKLHHNGAEGIVLGCTEIPLLIKETDVDVPIFDTTKIHVEEALNWALN